jgi:hypothetical protein
MSLTSSDLTNGKWHRVLFTFTGTSENTSTGEVTGTAKLYLNGTQKKSSTSAVIKSKIVRFAVLVQKNNSYNGSYSAVPIYLDNVAMVTGDIDIPPAPIKSGYSVSGAYLTLSGSPTVASFINNLTLTRKSYTVKVFDANGVQVGNDGTVAKGMTARIYEGNNFITQYYIK